MERSFPVCTERYKDKVARNYILLSSSITKVYPLTGIACVILFRPCFLQTLPVWILTNIRVSARVENARLRDISSFYCWQYKWYGMVFYLQLYMRGFKWYYRQRIYKAIIMPHIIKWAYLIGQKPLIFVWVGVNALLNRISAISESQLHGGLRNAVAP